MAITDIKFADRRRSSRRRINHPAFSPRSPQVFMSNQTVTPTGASVAIRPPRTALRRMDTKGAGTVSTF